MIDRERVIRVCREGDDRQRFGLAEDVVRGEVWSDPVLLEALDDASVRRWVRQYLLSRMPDEAARHLALKLLEWPEDLAAGRRDRSTVAIVHALSIDDVYRHLPLLAGSNAASALWERLWRDGQGIVADAVDQVFKRGDAQARETTLHVLALDPYGPKYLDRDQQDRILAVTLSDPDPEIRGLAAEVVAADMPELLFEHWNSVPIDDSERVRMAFWRAALVHHPDDAAEAAGMLVLDTEQPHTARRTALLALGEHSSTRQVSPVLQSLLRGNDEVLAGDAAQLMWRYHRAPDIANAAAESEFEGVRALANRLLHPELGSPAAGGSRPGDPTKTADIFQQIQNKENPER